MKVKEKLSLLISFVLIFTLGCSPKTTTKKEDNQSGSKIAKNSSNIHHVHKYKKSDLIKDKINRMTLDEKIGQLVISGIDGTSLNKYSKALITNYHVGGFILFSSNIKNIEQTHKLINSLKTTNSKHSNIPLFLGIDEEGGRVSRMPLAFKKLPTSKAVGTVNNAKFSYNIGKLLGRELNFFGFNIDFAPVMDINSNPRNPVIGDRSFGNNAAIVSKLGIATMKGIKSQKIISTIKHFPGHGDTSVDSHLGLPIVQNSYNKLKNRELIPFSSAIKNGADMVMVAHILLTKIDNKYPASLSKNILTGLLRKKLEFNGVIITDDMTMGAIEKNYSIEKAAVNSLKAGTDIILVCHGYNNEVKVIKQIKTAAKNKTLSIKSINEKVYRILKLKNKFKLKDTRSTAKDVNNINSAITLLLNKYTK
ncbi:beta-N-acetylhexosaminidase [Clostridium oryzae]|uniref:Beta-hexosaminidase n=1 Tax=Clostridium oryzae TaxID=1450648 RepID=A0A1V4ISP7_9CLOT|nr:beta-N-acetylhexosaminidase [Clostridium oryzae]OPJ62919.1 beta-hexosaminidase precursor [Clostridium oryzae]